MSPNRAVPKAAVHPGKRRSLILAAARAEFAEAGYAGARVDRIARRAGVNKQLLFYYFGSKAGLYQAAVRGAARDITEPAPRQTDVAPGMERLRRSLAELFDSLSARPDVIRFLLQDPRIVGGGESVEIAREVLTRLIADVRREISEGQGLGHFRDDVDPLIAARHAVVLALGYIALAAILSRLGSPVGSQADWRREVTDLLARSLAW